MVRIHIAATGEDRLERFYAKGKSVEATPDGLFLHIVGDNSAIVASVPVHRVILVEIE